MLLERLGIPPIFCLYNPDLYTGGVLSDLKKIFANLQAATSGVIPRKTADSLEFWTPQLAGQLRDVFLPALQRFDADIARAVLLPQLLGFTSDSDAGSFARANVHQDSFLYIIKYLQGLLADRVMNEQVIRPLLALNFANLDPKETPVFAFKPLDIAQRQGLTDRWLKAVQTGVIIPAPEDERYLREITSFPERDIPDDQIYTVRSGAPAQEGQGAPGAGMGGEPLEMPDKTVPKRAPVGQPKEEEDEPSAENMKALSDDAAALIAECERLAALSGRP
jgi:phage gp29-like protein